LPDLHIIETLQSVLESRATRRSPPPSSVMQLGDRHMKSGTVFH
jgi:hypothetical protein